MIQFQLTAREIVDRLWFRSLRHRRTLLSFAIFWTMGLVLLLWAPYPGRYFSALPLFFAIVGPFNMRALISQGIQADPRWTDSVTLDFDDSHITIRRSGSQSTVEWSQFARLQEDNDYIYLEISKSAVMAPCVIIPKRAFGGDQLSAFAQAAKNGIPH